MSHFPLPIALKTFLGRQSRSDRDKERHRVLMGGVSSSGQHSPSPREQFLHDQQQFLNAAKTSETSKASGMKRSPSGIYVLYIYIYIYIYNTK